MASNIDAFPEPEISPSNIITNHCMYKRMISKHLANRVAMFAQDSKNEREFKSILINKDRSSWGNNMHKVEPNIKFYLCDLRIWVCRIIYIVCLVDDPCDV